MKRLLFFLSFLVFSNAAWATNTLPVAVPANDECTGALSISTNCAIPTIGITLGATHSNIVPPNYYNSIADVWYKFTATSSIQKISLTNIKTSQLYSPSYSGVFIMSSCNPSNTNYLSGSNFYVYPSNSQTQTFNVYGLTVGTEYKVFVGGETIDFKICVTSVSESPVPSNATCANADILPTAPIGTGCGGNVSGTTYGSTQYDVINGVNIPVVWYKFKAVSKKHIFRMSNLQNTAGVDLITLRISVFSDCAASSYFGSYYATQIPISQTPKIETSNFIDFVPGTDYYVRVGGFSLGFNLCTESVDWPAPPANAVSGGALALTGASKCNDASSNGSTTGLWFKFVATKTTHNVAITNLRDNLNITQYFPYMYAYRDVSGTPAYITAYYLYAPGGNVTQAVTGLTIGNIYYIQLPKFSSTLYDKYTICVDLDATPADNYPFGMKTCLQDDYDALKSLYNSANGANWTDNTNWLNGTNLATWKGITLTPDGCDVAKIDLSNNNLMGNVPNLTLPQLTMFDISSNKLIFGDIAGKNWLPVAKYAPQAKIPLKSTNGLLSVSTGAPDADQTFKWYVNDLLVDVNNFSSFRPTVSGVWRCEISHKTLTVTSDQNKNLVLKSDNATFEVLYVPIGLHSFPEKMPECLQAAYRQLEKVYNTCNGTNWINKANWFTDPNLNNWYGIKLTDDGCDVKEINLSNNNLLGDLPQSFEGTLNQFAMPKLEVFNLSHNNLSNYIFYYNMPNLKVLDFSYNKLSGKIPDFHDCPKLQMLLLSNNNFDTNMPVFNLPDLTIVDVSNNNLNFGNLMSLSANGSSELMYAPQANIPMAFKNGVLSVSTGEPDITQQFNWYKIESQNLVGDLVATTASHEFAPTEAGYYYCEITHNIMTVTTDENRNLVLRSQTFAMSEVQATEIVVKSNNAKIKKNYSSDGAIFSIAPNPAKNRLTVTYNGQSDATLTVYDLIGRKMASKTISTTFTDIDISDYATGCYLIEIVAKGEVMREKLVKE